MKPELWGTSFREITRLCTGWISSEGVVMQWMLYGSQKRPGVYAGFVVTRALGNIFWGSNRTGHGMDFVGTRSCAVGMLFGSQGMPGVYAGFVSLVSSLKLCVFAGFDIGIEHPHTHVVNFCQLVRGEWAPH